MTPFPSRLPMNALDYVLHIYAAFIYGEESSCAGKIQYSNHGQARTACWKMNAKPTTKNVLEPYPCPFCQKWHVGRAMSDDEKIDIANKANLGKN